METGLDHRSLRPNGVDGRVQRRLLACTLDGDIDAGSIRAIPDSLNELIAGVAQDLTDPEGLGEGRSPAIRLRDQDLSSTESRCRERDERADGASAGHEDPITTLDAPRSAPYRATAAGSTMAPWMSETSFGSGAT